MSADFPDVPDAPGVPPVQRDASNPGTDTTMPAAADGDDVSSGPATPKWGIFDSSNQPVITADSFVSLEYSKDYDMPKYPMEGGAFQTYNKVEQPYSTRVRLSRGGTDADRSDFINAINTAQASLDLYSVVTPEFTYLKANIGPVNYARRAEQGATLIIAEIQLEQIRDSATVAFSSTKTPDAQGQVDAGAVQPRDPTAQEIEAWQRPVQKGGT